MLLDSLKTGEYSSLQWLAVAPLLALSTTLTTGLIAGLINLLLLIILSISISLLRTLVHSRLRLPIILLLVGTLACLMDMGMKFYLYGLYGSFNNYLPLLAVNSLIYAISGDYFFKNTWSASLRQALITGMVFMIWYVMLGLFREGLGYGTLFGDTGMLGQDAAWLHTIHFIDGFSGISLIHSPAGALISCGLLAALIKSLLKDDHARAVIENH
jgi:electron transport complex protein RnfE